jgi:hypothetical protein
MDTDDNLARFRQVLDEAVLAEEHLRCKSPRLVLGIFIGWRGLSLYGPVLVETTFFGRKAGATRISGV